MSRLSIIVPVYNAENTIRRCLDSILAQKGVDIELICVNDASPDNCAAILSEYEKTYPNIRIITHDKNQGLSSVRNTGMSTMEGDYFTFVDSDDSIASDPYFYAGVITKMESLSCDVCSFGYCSISEKEQIDHYPLHGEDHKIIARDEFAESISAYIPYPLMGFTWNKIYKNVLDIPLFNTQFSSYEDMLWLMSLCRRYNSFLIYNRIGYNYFFNPQSLSHNRNPKKSMLKDVYSGIVLGAIVSSLSEYTKKNKVAINIIRRRQLLAAWDCLRHSVRCCDYRLVLERSRKLFSLLSGFTEKKHTKFIIYMELEKDLPVATIFSLLNNSCQNWTLCLIAPDNLIDSTHSLLQDSFGFTDKIIISSHILEQNGSISINAPFNCVFDRHALKRIMHYRLPLKVISPLNISKTDYFKYCSCTFPLKSDCCKVGAEVEGAIKTVKARKIGIYF